MIVKPTKNTKQLPIIWRNCLSVALLFDCLVLAVLVSMIIDIMYRPYDSQILHLLPVAYHNIFIMGFFAIVTVFLVKVTLMIVNFCRKKVIFLTSIVVLFFLTGGVIEAILALIVIANYDQIQIIACKPT